MNEQEYDYITPENAKQFEPKQDGDEYFKHGCWWPLDAKGTRFAPNTIYRRRKPTQPDEEREQEQAGQHVENLVMPEGLDFRNGGQHCDMLTGPCACGAWHRLDDLPYRIFNQLKAEKAQPDPNKALPEVNP